MIKIGCAGFPVNQKLYQSKFGLVEIPHFLDKAPRPSTIQKWRDHMPPGFEYILCAPKLLTDNVPVQARMNRPTKRLHLPFTDGGSPARAFSNLQQAATILKSKLVLFILPNSLMSTADVVGRMQLFFNQIPRLGATYIWEPPLHWPTSLVERISQTLDLVPATNPLKNGNLPLAAFRYFRIGRQRGSGGITPLSDAELAKIKSACGSKLSYVIFNTGPHAFRDALRFSALCQTP